MRTYNPITEGTPSASHMKPSRGHTAIVTGASSGIGKGIAIVLAREGYDIVTVYQSNTEGIEQLKEIVSGTYGRRFHAFQGDLTDPVYVEQFAREALEISQEVHILVNNAGAYYSEKLTEIRAEEMIAFINIDFVAPVLLMKAVSRHMLEKNIRGSLINITSTRAERAYPHSVLYGGMKAGLQRAGESAALELAMHGIRVNSIAPGATRIERANEEDYKVLAEKIPLRRIGEPADIGEAVLWLSSDAASYITGITLKIDGGLILPGMPESEDETLQYYGWKPVKLESY
ncbi:SDR family NAD(P)-dependent oxidoreductase [Paenibacillus nasutitermitis]|uniref:Glucose 1-dehydrogenase 2 n=1 Tax=Paenibacillus nasutitermitis TaxID=1652958 RepID=A0A917DPC2_9BACL|nr:SDR family oxidoreductase [Paenibacillus nasutitermitis]GGD53617.1 glucose 1-dehydrogenase 2 [Paenibacillus nasutitermitis]